MEYSWPDSPKRKFARQCESCGAKFALDDRRAIQVHHKDPCGGVHSWESFLEFTRKQLVEDPAMLAVLCRECHKKVHEEDER